MKIRQVSLFIAFFIVNNQKMKDMITIAVGLANGFEEMEALVPVDVWRRAGYEVLTISVTGDKQVTGSHGITVIADKLFQETDFSKADMIFLPGGMPGTKNLDMHEGLRNKIIEFAENEKYLAAICAAPIVLGHNNLLRGKRATCFPGYENDLLGANVTFNSVEIDEKVITARGAGVSFEFAMRIVELLSGRNFAMQLGAKMQVSPSIIP